MRKGASLSIVLFALQQQVAAGFQANHNVGVWKTTATRKLQESHHQSSTVCATAIPLEENVEGGNEVGIAFPPPLTPLQRTTRAIEFYKRVLPVLAAYKAKELELAFRRKTLKETITDSEEDQIWKDIDEWGSTRVAETIQDMKGFYVKTGQGMRINTQLHVVLESNLRYIFLIISCIVGIGILLMFLLFKCSYFYPCRFISRGVYIQITRTTGWIRTNAF